jgi:poly(3-hydroxybutyrate) depolymerase
MRKVWMMYQFFQPVTDAADLVRVSASFGRALLEQLPPAVADLLPVRSVRAALQLTEETHLSHHRPAFGIETVMVDGVEEKVQESTADHTPFGSLLHFEKRADLVQPKVLVVAPLSGHFATLLRPTVRTLLADHDVYITDWHNARDTPLDAGSFGFSEYVSHVIRFIESIGEPMHLLSVCQPCPSALVAAAVMAQGNHPLQPLSLTLMAGPVDARVSPTKVNELATSKPIEWFEKHVISTVPSRYPGAGRRVYPGFVQISAFMSMNVERHLKSHVDMLGMLTRGDQEADYQFKRDFYDEYYAVLDIPAEFYLETVRSVFQEFELARGVATYQGRRVEPRALKRTALLTVEGDRDDICAVGQTLAAHDLCAGVPPARRQHHLQAGVGHYGVFSGSRWNNEIYPKVRHFILANS